MVEVEATHAYAEPPDVVFARAVDPVALARTFSGYAGLIPGIASASVRGELAVGALRDVALTDGSRIVERITAHDPPSLHAYDMAEMNGLQRFLCTNMRSTWRFEPDGAGTRITWTYAIDARAGRGWLAWVVGRLFARAMRRCLAHLEDPGSG